MKKRSLCIITALMCLLALLSLLSGCEGPIQSKQLIVVNNSEFAIDTVEIRQFVFSPKTSELRNALQEETIEPGAKKTFYLAPYSLDWVELIIEDENDNGDYISFKYDYLVKKKNEAITATYDGTEIILSGSNFVIEEEET